MRNALFATLFILIFGNLCRFGLPWWGLAPIAALATLLFPLPGGKSFSTGFSAGFLLWSASAFLLNSANLGVLAGKIGQIFLGLRDWHLIGITAFLGGLLAAFGALTGSYARQLIFPPKKRRRYHIR
jgi:hypothetical protein